MNISIYDNQKRKIGVVSKANLTIHDDNGVEICGIWKNICPFYPIKLQTYALFGLSSEGCYRDIRLVEVSQKINPIILMRGIIMSCEEILTDVELANFKILYEQSSAGEKPLNDRDIPNICEHSQKGNTFPIENKKVIDEILKPLIEKGFLSVTVANHPGNSGSLALSFLKKPESED